jgi:hypothetical protein
MHNFAAEKVYISCPGASLAQEVIRERNSASMVRVASAAREVVDSGPAKVAGSQALFGEPAIQYREEQA